jgi:hypothetical protein
VERAGPELSAYAREHTSLCDNPAVPAWRVAGKTFLILWLFFTVLFGSIGVLEGFQKQSFQAALVGIGIIQAIFLPIICLSAVFMYASYDTADWNVEVKGGTVWIGGCQIPLAKCQWFVGKMTDATRPPFVPRIAAVLLATRPEGEIDEVVMPVSVNPAMFSVWTGFLTLAGSPRRTVWERRTTARRATYVAGGIAAVILSALSTAWLGMQCGAALDRLNAPKAVADGVRFAIAIQGGLLAGIGVAVLWPWKALQRVPSRRSLEDQRRIRREYLVGGMLTSILALTYATVGGLIGVLVCLLVALAIGTSFGFIVGHFKATRDLITTEESLAG